VKAYCLPTVGHLISGWALSVAITVAVAEPGDNLWCFAARNVTLVASVVAI
jgi:hypothetical protein